MKMRSGKYAWMSDDQWECFVMVCDMCGGEHHVYAKVKPFGKGIEINMGQSLSTYDPSELTGAVILAHDRMIRFEVMLSGPGLLRLVLHKRHGRTGRQWDRHPTMEDAIRRVRGAQE